MITRPCCRDVKISDAAAEGWDCWEDVLRWALTGDLGGDRADGGGNRVDAVAAEFGTDRKDVLQRTINRARREIEERAVVRP